METPAPVRDQITELLLRATEGQPADADRLFERVYPELRRIAQSFLSMERPDHTLQATELVHEAYLRLVDQTPAEWKNRVQFLAIAGRAMRRILTDHARYRGREKRGGGWQRVPLDQGLQLGTPEADTVMIALADARNLRCDPGPPVRVRGHRCGARHRYIGPWPCRCRPVRVTHR